MPTIAASYPLAPKASLPRKGLRAVSYLVAPGLLGLLVSTYAASPAFFLQYIHEDTRRELMAIELTTVSCAALGGMLLAAASARQWKARQTMAAGLLAVVACAAVFFAGEEMSWGQSYFGWRTPEGFFSRETNLHNSALEVQSLGSLFLITVFFILPAWARIGASRGRPLPKSWRPAIASGPVVSCLAVAFAWKEVKSLYHFWYADHKEHLTYQEFIMHINEHKEMLVAVTLLMFGVTQVGAAWATKRPD